MQQRKKPKTIKRYEKYYVTGEEVTSKKIVFDLFRSCRSMLKLDSGELTKASKEFLERIKSKTDEVIKDFDDINLKPFLNDKRRPFLFELIRLEEQSLSESSYYSNKLGKVIDYLGYQYGTSFTEEDIKKLIVGQRFMLLEDVNIKLSLDDCEIFCDNREVKTKKL